MDESTKTEIAALRAELQKKRDEIKEIQQKLTDLRPVRVKEPQV